MNISGINDGFLNNVADFSIDKGKIGDISFEEVYNEINTNTEENVNTVKKETSKEDVLEAGEKFESYFAYKILKNMHDNIPKSGVLSDRNKHYNDMLIDVYSKEIAKGNGFGIKEMIVSQLSKGK